MESRVIILEALIKAPSIAVLVIGAPITLNDKDVASITQTSLSEMFNLCLILAGDSFELTIILLVFFTPSIIDGLINVESRTTTRSGS